MVVSRAGMGRFTEALRLSFGAAIAEGIYAALAFWGFATFLARYEAAVSISRGVTAVVLFAVGLHFVRWTPKAEDHARPERGRSAFFVGFTTSMLNPTLLLTWSAVTTGIYSRQIVAMTSLLALPFGIAAGLGIASWNLVLVTLMRRFHEKVPKAFITWTVRSMGLLLIAIAMWSAVDLSRQFLFR